MRFWRTDEVITLEKCTQIYEKYKGNWGASSFDQLPKQGYSENNEDGVLKTIFEIIKPESRYYVEFGARDGYSLSNTLYFRECLGWNGLLLDCDYEDETINLHKEFVTRANINNLFDKYSVPKAFDLLSIDIDGNDFYIWQALIYGYQPRVVVIETNQLIPLSNDRTIVYDPDFVWEYDSRYFGAGLRTMWELGLSTGYSLVACIDQNAVFVCGEDTSKLEISQGIEKLFKPRMPRWYVDKSGQEVEYPKEFVENPDNQPLLSQLVPIIEKSMRQEDTKNRQWTTGSLS